MKEKQPVLIPGTSPITQLRVTNGFHCSRVVTVKYNTGIYFYEVECYLDNIRLITGLLMALLFFFFYIITGNLFFMVFANVPLLMMLYIFYAKRNDFIQIHATKPENI